MRHWLALLAICASPAAFAQGDAPVEGFDPKIAEICADQGGEDCVGLAASHCIETSEIGFSNVGMGFCVGAELDWWDTRLNAVYRELSEAEAKSDAEIAELGGALAPSSAPDLKAMQRAWIAYRDALCEKYEASQWGGGSGTYLGVANCMLHETARQVRVLEGYMRQKDER
ncbi:lysozyme inhibitor LprI family protein [Paracoccaceae bacterium GXU_MW_L88]